MPTPPSEVRRGLRDVLPVPPYRPTPERLDHPEHESEADLRRTLRDLRLGNRLGGSAVVLEHLEHLTRGWPKGRTLRVLDLATGAADIPLQVVRWAARRGLDVEVEATDVSERVLAVAREYVGRHPRVRLAVQDARHLSYADRSFDVVICCTALHHFERPEAVAVLREMSRLARVGFIVSDLERCFGAWLTVMLASLTPVVGGLTRHDGPASAARAFTAHELLELARQAGLSSARVVRHLFFRHALVEGPRA
jgi:ubiquinone/menaquinone biosynthesis C-methylase UbiE